MGGTEVTITGKNFSPISQQNQVVIDTSFCKIISATETEIKCVTPPHEGGSIYEVDLDVMTRITEQAKCVLPAGCKFTYVSGMTPQITSYSHFDPLEVDPTKQNRNVKDGELVTLQGTLTVNG